MSLFVLREESVENGTKVVKERINWKPIIFIIIAVLAVIGIIVFFTSRASDIMPTTSASTQPPISAPTQEAPVQEAPAQTPAQTPTTVAEPGVVVLTTDELFSQLTANPNRYKPGTVMQVTGTAVGYSPTVYMLTLVSIKNIRDDWRLNALSGRDSEGGENISTAFIKGQVDSYPNDPIITVRGAVLRIDAKNRTIFLEESVAVTNAK